jgi:hypothetical protein
MCLSVKAIVVGAAIVVTNLAPLRADAADEIEVYNAEIAEVGQWIIQQHLNYTWARSRVSPVG